MLSLQERYSHAKGLPAYRPLSKSTAMAVASSARICSESRWPHGGAASWVHA